jgi:carbamoyl-phosphate synthase large subunit
MKRSHRRHSAATVAITGMNARPDNPGPGLAVARCLRADADFQGRIFAMGYDALDPGLYLDEVCDAGYLLPYPSAGEAALHARLAAIHAQSPIDVLIPCLDAELPALVRMVPVLRQWGIHTWLPTAEQLQLRSKDRLSELATHAGIIAPDTVSVTQRDFFTRCAREGWDYPFVVKGVFYDAEIVHTPAQAEEAFRRIAAAWGFPVLAQRLVKGEEYNLSAVGDGTGGMLGAVMMKKMAVTDKGKAWSGVTIDDPALLQASARLIAATNWRGPLEVEVIKDGKGRYQLIEINPRFPAWIYLSAAVGVNLPKILLALALGESPPPAARCPTGQLFLRYPVETVIPISEFESIVITGERRRPT